MKTSVRLLALAATVLPLGLAQAATPAAATAASPTAASPAAFPWPPAWITPVEPLHIAGPIYFFGTQGLAGYLIKTSDGLIMIDGGMPDMAANFEAQLRKLGFKPTDIKLLLLTHAHIDHAGTTTYFKKLSGAKLAVMDRDVPHMESGGRTDPVYGKAPPFYFGAAKVDRVLRDGDKVAHGGMVLTARLGAGHAQGATTWITDITVGGRTYNVVFPCCTGVNPNFGPVAGHQLVVNPSYPGIADDYRNSFRMLEGLKPDIWLGSHTDSFDFENRRKRAATEGIKAWVDPAGYFTWLAAEKVKFEAAVQKELAAPKK
jgi:metallo-beta-lactamase class B